MIFGECDSCGAKNRVLHTGRPMGMEACFCRICQRDALIEDEGDLQDEIDRLRPLAETGEQWGHLCALYAALLEMRAEDGRVER